MASSSRKAQHGSWTEEENKRFEMALARYEEGCPRRWANVARAVGRRSAEVELHYHHLLNDINLIDSTQQPFFQFTAPAPTSRPPPLHRHRRPEAEDS